MGRKKKDTITTTNIDQTDANNLTIAVNYDEKLQLDLMDMWKKILKWGREKLFVDPVTEEIAPVLSNCQKSNGLINHKTKARLQGLCKSP